MTNEQLLNMKIQHQQLPTILVMKHNFKSISF